MRSPASLPPSQSEGAAVQNRTQSRRPGREFNLGGIRRVDDPGKQQRIVAPRGESRLAGRGADHAGLPKPRKKLGIVNPARIAEVRQAGRVQPAGRQGRAVLAQFTQDQLAIVWHPMPVGVELDVGHGGVKLPAPGGVHPPPPPTAPPPPPPPPPRRIDHTKAGVLPPRPPSSLSGEPV